jgi:hypothetical protein
MLSGKDLGNNSCRWVRGKLAECRNLEVNRTKGGRGQSVVSSFAERSEW